MFQFGRFPFITYVFSYESMALRHRGCPIRKSAGQRIFPPNRSLSQVITSFIGSQCQGIHLMLFFAWTAVRFFSISLEMFFRFSFFCLSFANNCFLGCKLKDLFGFIIHWFLSASISRLMLTKLFPLLLYGKTFKIFVLTSFSQYTTICFVSFVFLFGFQWTVARALNSLVGPSGLEPP